jgi:parallel beta-helix repeat protein
MTASLFGTGGVVNVNVNGSLVPQSFTATASQTLFTLSGWTYTPGTNSLLVFINGQRQVIGRDFNETSSSSFTLVEGCIAGDFVDVIGFPQIGINDNSVALKAQLADTATAANGAGLVGFNYSLNYIAGTFGKWVQDLSTSVGSTFIGWLSSRTGAVLRTISNKLDDQISAFDFMTAAQIADIKAGTLVLDVTVPLQAFFDACKYRHGFLNPGKYKLTSTINLDYTASYWISGAGFDINGINGTVLQHTANAPCLSINNPTAGAVNVDIVLEHFCINGNNAGFSQEGIYARLTPIVLKEVYVVNCGAHGIHLERCFSSTLSNCILANNYRHGLFLDKQANEVLISHCFINGNSRSAGYAGVSCVGTSGNENLNVVFLSCDITGNGAAAASGYGYVVQYTHGCKILSSYSEANKTNVLYVDNTVKNLSVDSCYIQDEKVSIVGCDGIEYVNNRHFFNSIATDVAIGGAPGSPLKIEGNTFGASVTKNFTSGAKQRIEQYDTAAPSSGTWSSGDIIWHSAPSSAGNIGWVCTVGGTPGTWKSFGTIA